jgi:hypothetical protein
MQRQLPESVERSASLSAAQVGGQRMRPGLLSGTRRAARPVSDLDLVRRTLRMRQPRRRHVAEGVIDLGLGLGLGGMKTSG